MPSAVGGRGQIRSGFKGRTPGGRLNPERGRGREGFGRAAGGKFLAGNGSRAGERRDFGRFGFGSGGENWGRGV